MKTFLTFILLLFVYPIYSQNETDTTVNKTANKGVDADLLKPDTTFMWHYADYEEDGYAGISLKQAYDFAKEKNLNSHEIIVAIIDSGIDTSHVDLKDNLWVNPNEIPYNGIDDDGNGYIDDIHGWNFLGNQNGYCIDGETLEETRLYRDLKKRFKNKSKKDIAPEDKEDYELWLEVSSTFMINRMIYKSLYKSYKNALEYYDKCEKMLANYFDDPNFTREDVESLEPRGESLAHAKEFYLRWENRQELENRLETMNSYANKKYNVLYNPRKKIGDDPLDINDTIYGNNILYVGKSSSHGTGVSGIVGAVRDNNIGINGIAPNVKLMIIRVVPGGDERDKDVALAIRYAVNHRARIINCSFGKNYSPQKEFVDEAVRYAGAHNVLIVHAAGNDSKNIDKGKNFPTKKLDNPEEIAKNWIEVGASNRYPDDSLVAEFSNYGMLVDIFAPGVDIHSTAIKSKYSTSSGTSDAAPVVTGVAALVLSYFPDFTAEELKEIITQSGIYYGNLKVLKPEEYKKRKKKKFKKFVSNPRVVNAYQSLVKAYEQENRGS